MKDDNKIQGMNFLGWLTLLFIGLKLTGFINWSLWWVLSPIWIPLGVIIVIGFIIAVYQTVKEMK